jgi:putative inorganic carbon (HCO3(-)) transporter
LTAAPKVYRLYLQLMMLWALFLPWFFIGIQIVPGLLFLVILYQSITTKEWPIKWHPFFSFMLTYLAIRLITTLITPAPLRLRALESFIDTEWPLFSLLFLSAITIKPGDIKRILHVLLFSASLAGFYSIFQFIYGIDIFRNVTLSHYGQFYRAVGSYGFFLSFAGNQLMALAIAVVFFLCTKNHKRFKLLYGIALFLILFSLLATFARSTWIAFGIIFLMAPLMINKRLFLPSIAILVLIVVLLLLYNPDLARRLSSIFDTQQNITRLNLWRTSLAMILDNPWSGIGSGMYGDFFPYYKFPGFYDTVSHSHNDFLQIATISGFPGLTAWIALWGSWLYFGLKQYKNSAVNSLERPMVSGIVLSIVAIQIAAFFQCYYLDLKNCIFMNFILLIGLNLYNTSKIPYQQ